MNTNQKKEEMETENIPEWYSSLSLLQKTYLTCLRMSGIEGAALAGCFLILKEDIPAMEDVVLLVNDDKVKGEELEEMIIDYAIERQERQER